MKWTWCPKCGVRTDHHEEGDKLVCEWCGVSVENKAARQPERKEEWQLSQVKSQ